MTRACLICGSEDVVTPLLGMFALALCAPHRAIVQDAHALARAGGRGPLLDEAFARRAIAGADVEAAGRSCAVRDPS